MLDATAADFEKRLDKMVRYVLRSRFDTAGLWKLQLDLLKLQREIQEAITAAKPEARKDAVARGRLSALRSIRWHSRRFGDALAWLFFGMDRQMIYPLSRNSRVRIDSDDQGSKGVVAISQVLSEKGWGFPLLHDITDCLRIGDVTFIKRGSHPRTIEVKTRFVREKPDDDDRGAIVEYEISVVFSDDGSTPPNLGARPPIDGPPIEAPQYLSEPRTRRQLRRMDEAIAAQIAKDDELSTVNGLPHLTVKILLEPESNLDAMQRVVRRARRIGYAAEVVEDAFVYMAIYDAQGLEDGRAQAHLAHISGDVVRGIVPEERKDRNSLVVLSIPEQRGGAQLFMPYFLYSLPKTSRLDILHGRMMLFVLVNPGQVAKALEAEGFRVLNPSGRGDLKSDSFVIETGFEDLDGRRYRGELHNLDVHFHEMLMEFRSVSFIVEIAKTMHHAVHQKASSEGLFAAS